MDEIPINPTIIKPTREEAVVLEQFFKGFLVRYREIRDPGFYKRSAEVRLLILKELFSIYNELYLYEPIRSYIDTLDTRRPASEKFIALDCFRFIRNIFIHYPFFRTWDEIYMTKSLASWSKNIKNNAIDKFLKKCTELDELDRNPKFRVWDSKGKVFHFYEFAFPNKYDERKIYLREIVEERAGIEFCTLMMLKVLAVKI